MLGSSRLINNLHEYSSFDGHAVIQCHRELGSSSIIFNILRFPHSSQLDVSQHQTQDSTMTRVSIAKLGRVASRGIGSRTTVAALANRSWGLARPLPARSEVSRLSTAAFSTNTTLSRPVSAEALKTAQPADITGDEYHKLADQYIDDILVRFEEEQDAKGEIDVEYSVRHIAF